VLVVFLAQFPLGVVGQAYASYQRTHVANMFGIAGSFLSIGMLLVAIRLRLGLPYLILAMGGFSILLGIAELAYLGRLLPWLRPRWRYVTREALTGLMKISTPMLLFQLGSLMNQRGADS